MRRRVRDGAGNTVPTSLRRYVAAEWDGPEDWFAAWSTWTKNWHDEHPDEDSTATLSWWLEAAKSAPDVPFDGTGV